MSHVQIIHGTLIFRQRTQGALPPGKCHGNTAREGSDHGKRQEHRGKISIPGHHAVDGRIFVGNRIIGEEGGAHGQNYAEDALDGDQCSDEYDDCGVNVPNEEEDFGMLGDFAGVEFALGILRLFGLQEAFLLL